MTIQRTTGTLGNGMSKFDFSPAWRFGPDRDDLCTELRRHYWDLSHRPSPADQQQFLHLKQQIKAAYYRWMSVQTQLFSGTTFDPNR